MNNENARAIAFKARLHKEKQLKVKLTGRCMSPLFEEGDEALIQKLNSIDVGKIYLVFNNANEFALHRLVDIQDQNLQFKGDLIERAEFLSRDNILGELVAIKIRNAKGFTIFKEGKLTCKLKVKLSKMRLGNKPKRKLAKVVLCFLGVAKRHTLRK